MVALVLCPAEYHGQHLDGIAENIREYLQREWSRQWDNEGSVAFAWKQERLFQRNSFTPETMPAIKAEVPRQPNGFDCGLFMLAYLERWCTVPPSQSDMQLKSTPFSRGLRGKCAAFWHGSGVHYACCIPEIPCQQGICCCSLHP